MAHLDLSVVIVNWNTRLLLLQCVESVIATTISLTYEIIVFDNNSVDGSADVVKSMYPQIRLIRGSSNLGFSKANNLALSQSRGRCIIIAHPDVKFENDAIHEMQGLLRRDEAVGIVGANLIYPDGTYNRCALGKRNLRRELYDFGFPIDRLDRALSQLFRRIGIAVAPLDWDHQSSTETASVWNACMMFKRDLLLEIGPFDERFFVWFADTDWCYRARESGWKIMYVESAKVVHYETQSGGYLDTPEVRYKLDSLPVIDLMRADLDVLYQKHFGVAYRKAANIIRRGVGLKARMRAKFSARYRRNAR